MNLTDLHRRLLRDVLEIGVAHGFVITGGYAVQAHGLVNRLSRDLDVATQSPAQMEAIAAALADELSVRGWQVRKIEADPLSARMMIIDPVTGESCEVDMLKEAFYHPPQTTEYGPVLALEDVIGTKVRALADRGAARDLIDVRAASSLFSTADLENLGRRHARDEFRLEDLAARLDGAAWFDDEAFTTYGLTEDDVSDLRAWARAWSDDIADRISEQVIEDDLP
jgi:Nucleotidyl transferase AbiEii toxin, Type IV TA system